MLVMKIRSSSPVNMLVGMYRGFMCMYKKKRKKVAIYSRLSPATGESGLSMVNVQKKNLAFISCFAYYPFIGSIY